MLLSWCEMTVASKYTQIICDYVICQYLPGEAIDWANLHKFHVREIQIYFNTCTEV